MKKLNFQTRECPKYFSNKLLDRFRFFIIPMKIKIGTTLKRKHMV